MAQIKTGKIWLEDGGMVDAVWGIEYGMQVQVSDENDFLVLQIDPENIKAIAAIIIQQEREAHMKALDTETHKKNKKWK